MPAQLTSTIQQNRRLQGDYYRLDLTAPPIAVEAAPGQFVHVQLPNLAHRILRRPFSIFDTDSASGRLSIVYKVVGEGTAHLATLPAGTQLDLLGPLGHGYTDFPQTDCPGLIVAGGYGAAALFLLAKRAAIPPIVLLGGRSQGDLLLVDDYRQLGCDVRLSTNDGSAGRQGLVTLLLQEALAQHPQAPVAACGPNPMLKAVCAMADGCHRTEISLDHAMCCGVGACFACVVKQKADTPEGWTYVRTCKEGPVFSAETVFWD